MTKALQPQQELTKASGDILDSVKVGDWFWVKFEDEEWQGKDDDAKLVKVGEHEELMCVETVGSNYVGFTRSDQHGTSKCRVHFDNFFAECREEPNWKEQLQKRMDDVQKQIREKTQKLMEHGRKLFLLPSEKPVEVPEQGQSMLPAKVADEPKRYKKELVKFEKKMPELTKEIDELAGEYAVVAKDMALPDLVRLKAIKGALSVVSDRIFTIEIYAGIQEEVVQISDGEPALANEKVAIRQMMLFMDEETLFNYETGGMDYKNIEDFDEWVVKPENLSRIMPEPKGIVAFRVRRESKDYGPVSSMLQAWIRMEMDEANMQTYLLIRNGQRVYRIASAIDFSPRLIPKKNEIGEEQFKKIDSKWVWKEDDKDKKWGLGGTHERVEEEVLITKDSVEFDDHMEKMDALIKKYNRVVILIQGLLDRSTVFHPHPPINLLKKGQIDEWVRLIRDEETALPGIGISFEEYLNQLNKTLKPGKWVYVLHQYRKAERENKWSGKHYTNLHGKTVELNRPRRSWIGNDLPAVCKVDSIKRDRSAVQVSWPKGEVIGRYVDIPGDPYHQKWSSDTDRMCHEWIPTGFVMNLSDYMADNYKMFLCDRALQGQYLEWAGALLTAEDWARERAKGANPDEYKKAKARTR